MSRTERDVAQLLPDYPANVVKPVADLIERGILDENTVITVREIAGRKGERHRFLYHLLLIDGLRKQGVPVDDTVMMAREAGMAVNLHWSRTRWREEHNRLSRWKTLQQLAAQSQAYDLTYFEALLPDQWPGYLIRTSRRLGMEGLRQRHCVASYDSRIRLGHCAIAVVFVDRKRYTVELVQASPSQPIAIAQIKGRYNSEASEAVVERIGKILGVPMRKHTAFPFQRENPAAQQDRALHSLRQVLPRLRAEGITRISVYFDGSGDTSMIEDPVFYRGDTRIAPDSPNLDPADLELLEQAFAAYLDSTGVDWYNNDGGYGNFDINVETGHFEVDVNTRYLDSSCEHFAELNLYEDEAGEADAA